MSHLGAVSTGVSRLAVTGVVSDAILACSMVARSECTLVNIELTRLSFQSCLTLALIVVDEIVAVGLCSLTRIAFTVIDVDLTEFSLETQGAATPEVFHQVQTGPIVVTVHILALTQFVTVDTNIYPSDYISESMYKIKLNTN